jgi:hypothetical protein
MKVFRLIAWIYALIVFLTASHAWYFDIRLLNMGGEHMFPDLLLLSVTFPTSLSLGPLYDIFPTFFDRPFTQLTWITLCGVGQMSALFVAGIWFLVNRSTSKNRNALQLILGPGSARRRRLTSQA